MADFDIFNPEISKVTANANQTMQLWHSSENKVGKTAQACRMPKPFYLRFEQGNNAIDNVPYAPLTSWADFKKVNKQLTNPATLERAKQTYTTIIWDTIDVGIQWCTEFVCNTNGIKDLSELPYGKGYKLFETEWFKEVNKLANAGYTLIFISHSKEKEETDPVTGEKYTQMCAIGGAKDTGLILNLVDFIGYIKSNGLDSEGNEIPSSIYFSNTKSFKAGSRFKYMPKVVDPFTAENLQAAIKEAIEKQVAETGHKAITFEERKEMEKKDKVPFDTLMKMVQEVGEKLVEAGHVDDVIEIIESVLGTGKKVQDCKPRQYDAVDIIYSTLCDKAEELGV